MDKNKFIKTLNKISQSNVEIDSRVGPVSDIEEDLCGDCYRRIKAQGYGVGDESICDGFRRLINEDRFFDENCMGRANNKRCNKIWKKFKDAAESGCNHNLNLCGCSSNPCKNPHCISLYKSTFQGTSCSDCGSIIQGSCDRKKIIKDCLEALSSPFCCGGGNSIEKK